MGCQNFKKLRNSQEALLKRLLQCQLPYCVELLTLLLGVIFNCLKLFSSSLDATPWLSQQVVLWRLQIKNHGHHQGASWPVGKEVGVFIRVII